MNWPTHTLIRISLAFLLEIPTFFSSKSMDR
jgi:hypothetical protein